MQSGLSSDPNEFGISYALSVCVGINFIIVFGNFNRKYFLTCNTYAIFYKIIRKKEKDSEGREFSMSRILRYLACLFMLIFAGNALAGAYYCPSMKKYTSCEPGYYVDDCGSYRDGRLLSTTRLTVGNECASCPTGYSCQGGRYCPEEAGVTVKYNLNGGSGTAPADQTCNLDVACLLDRGRSTTYYRAGYVLIGWSTDPDATTGVWSMYISPTETVNLYAVWQPCAAGTYKGGSGVPPIGVCSECPALSEGLEYYAPIPATAITQCAQATYDASTVDSDCASVTYQNMPAVIQTANADGTWRRISISAFVGAVPGSYVNYTDNTDASQICIPCTGATYSEGGQVAECTACPTATEYADYVSNYSYDPDKTVHDSADGCRVLLNMSIYAPPSDAHIFDMQTRVYCTLCDGDYGVSTSCGETACYARDIDRTIICDASYYNTYVRDPSNLYKNITNIDGLFGFCESVGDGYWSNPPEGDMERTQCPAGYRDGPAATSEQGCIMKVDGGNYVATANASTATECVAGTYKEGPYDVNYGSTSTCDSCPALTDGFEFPPEIAGATSWSGCAQVSYDAHAVNEYCAPNSVAQSLLLQMAASPTTWGAGGMAQGAAVDGAYLDTSIASDPVADWSKVCQLCPAGYRDGSGANNINGCVMNVDGGYHVGTAGASTAAQCSADTYMGAHDVNYGSTSTCDTCPSGYPNSVAGSDAITDCYSDTKQRPWTGSQVNGSVPSGCYRVTAWNSCSNGTCSYTAYSNEDGTADGAHKSGCTSNDGNCTKTPSQVTARAGHYVSGTTCPECKAGQFQNIDDNSVNGCYLCTGNTYAEGTGNTDCTMCDDGYAITAGSASVYHDERSDCRITCEPGTGVFEPYEQCTTQSGTWYIDESHTVNAGDTSDDYMNYCIAGYSTPRTTSPSDHDAVGDCTISCDAGTQIASANATSCTTPSGNWYIGEHSVSQGNISPVNNCLTNYTITGTSPSNHDNVNDCKISCDGGEYLATKNATSCSDVTPGYWAAPSTVSQGSTGVRNACASGLTTIGFGAGADEAGDCGRVLHIGDDTLYLRSDKKTTHALHVGINGTTFYGNMGTDLSRGSLRIKLGSTTYSVYDDSME